MKGNPKNPAQKIHTGPALVTVAALLWGTDSVFRYQISDRLDPTFIVFIEHLLAVAAFLPWVLWTNRKKALRLSRKEWAAAVFVGVFGSALATTMFTVSFLYVNPSVAVLLQKLQPVLVVFIAFAVLGERPKKKFYFWAALSLAAGVVLSFPDGKFNLIAQGRGNHAKGVLLAFSAAMVWGAATIGGKILLVRTAPGIAIFWRYFFGFTALSIMLLAPHDPLHANAMSSWPIARAVLYVSILSGIVPMVVYYTGLKRTSASITTFIELLYPISAVILNTLILHMPLLPMQVGAGVVLVFAVTMISL